MGASRQPRVLMLGWEYPPRFAGGLGKACRGLSVAMARQGAQVFFVLPSFPEGQLPPEPRLEVLGAREALTRSGLGAGALTFLRSKASLLPYASPPAREDVTRGDGGSSSGGGDGGGAKAGVADELYGRNLWSEIEQFCITARQLAEWHEVDVVHAHDWMTFPAAFEFQRVTGTPVFLHVHATEYDRSGESVNSDVFRIEQEGFQRASHVFAVSRYTGGIIERLYGIARSKLSVVYNAPAEEARELISVPDAEREPNVVFLGRLTFQKGPDHFLRAAALVSAARPDARFLLCGTGDLLDQLKDQAQRLGIASRVTFSGFIEPAEVDRVLQRSRVLVMPSVSEPFGLVALEAIHCGVPVIISKQSGVREVLHRALQVDFWDHERLADQILAALRLRDLSRQLVHDGMEQVRELTWERSARRVISVYREHIGETYAQAVGGAHGR